MHRIILTSHWHHSCRPLEAISNWLRNRSFPYPWWTSQKQHKSLLRVDSFVFGNKLKNSLLSLGHSIMALPQNCLRIGYIPIRVYFLVPRKSEHILKVGDLLWVVIFGLWLQPVNFNLDELPDALGHVDDSFELFIEGVLLRFLVFTDHFLESSFDDWSLGPILELFSRCSDHHHLHLDEIVESMEVLSDLLSSLDWVVELNELFLLLHKLLKIWHKAKSVEDFEVIGCHSESVLVQHRVHRPGSHVVKSWELQVADYVLVQILSGEGN